jgi:hypothetical protein
MNLSEFLFTLCTVFSVSGFIIFLRHMAYTIANSAEETEKVFIEKNEKNNLTNA